MLRALTVISILLTSLAAGNLAGSYSCCYGQAKRNARYQAYFDRYKDVAIEQMFKYKIPASITLAQGVFESGAGQSELARKGNNHFGIKCHDWTGARTYHDDDERHECFRSYDNAYESYEDHSRFLVGSKRYQRLFALKTTDYKGWARGLKACGYATNPAYATKLIEIIELYELDRYDHARSYDRFVAHSAAGQSTYAIHMCNGVYYVRARQGDTFSSIGQELGISHRKLARYNERDRRATLVEGEPVYLKKKRLRAAKDYKKRPHVVRSGESIYSISQLYGMRMSSIYELNKLSADYQLKVGDTLRIR